MLLLNQVRILNVKLVAMSLEIIIVRFAIYLTMMSQRSSTTVTNAESVVSVAKRTSFIAIPVVAAYRNLVNITNALKRLFLKLAQSVCKTNFIRFINPFTCNVVIPCTRAVLRVLQHISTSVHCAINLSVI